MSARKPWHAAHEQCVKSLPKRQDAVIDFDMPAQRAMALIRIAVEANMFDQEMPEGSQQRTIPVGEFQDRAEDTLQPAILVARDAGRTGLHVETPRHFEISRADSCISSGLVGID